MALSFWIIFTLVHSFHFSKTEVNYESKTNTIQISSKVFIDDLEDELKLYGHTNLKIGTKFESPNVDSLLALYFEENLHISEHKNAKKQYFLGKELSNDLLAIWAYIEIPLEEEIHQLTIQNTILTTLYDDQKNMLIVKKDNKMIGHETLDDKETSFNITINP